MTAALNPTTRPVRVAIVDDESLVRSGIRTLLRAESDVRIVGEAQDGHAAVSLIRRERPELVFLDVQLPELTGFDVLSRLEPEMRPAVVFVTAYSVHATRAFDHYAVDYLLKPFDRDRFRVALERARARLNQVAAGEAGQGAVGGREPSSPYIKRVLVQRVGRSIVIPISDVDWFEAQDNYVRIHTATGRHLIRMKLGALVDQLDPQEFIRIHRSAVVRVSRVRELRARFGSRYHVVLASGEQLPLSRSHRDAVRAALGRPA